MWIDSHILCQRDCHHSQAMTSPPHARARQKDRIQGGFGKGRFVVRVQDSADSRGSKTVMGALRRALTQGPNDGSSHRRHHTRHNFFGPTYYKKLQRPSVRRTSVDNATSSSPSTALPLADLQEMTYRARRLRLPDPWMESISLLILLPLVLLQWFLLLSLRLYLRITTSEFLMTGGSNRRMRERPPPRDDVLPVIPEGKTC